MQEIVDSLPNALDETKAKEEWDWKAEYCLDNLVEDFVKEVRF